MPNRVQLKRTKGFRLPPNTLKVDRSTRWGNPFPVSKNVSATIAVYDFKLWLRGEHQAPDGSAPPSLDEIRRELAGKNLACWCKDEPCHASVLLEIANAKEGK